MLSFPENIPAILRVMFLNKPKKILDVGPGLGKYGLLIREQDISTKVEKAAKEGGSLVPTDDLTIDCTEDTAYFHQGRPGKILEAVYDHVLRDDIFSEQAMANIKNQEYDWILFIDTVEHWKKDATIALLKEISKYSNILISTPMKTGMYTAHLYDDPRHHITQWAREDFLKNFAGAGFRPSRFSHIVCIPKIK